MKKVRPRGYELFTIPDLVARGMDDAFEDDDEPVFRNVLMTYRDLTDDLGYSSTGGPSLALKRSFKKLRFLLDVDSRDLRLVWLEAISLYVGFLESSGELSDEEFRFLCEHPFVLAESQEFRLRFGNVIDEMMKGTAEPWNAVTRGVDPRRRSEVR